MTTARRLPPEAARGSAEVWGWCSMCERWFYPRNRSVDLVCPVCASPAARTGGQPGTPEQPET